MDEPRVQGTPLAAVQEVGHRPALRIGCSPGCYPGPVRGLGAASTILASRRRLRRSISPNSGPTTAKPSRPASPSGRSRSSDQTNQAPPGAGSTTKLPVPRRTRPRWRTSTRRGGSQRVTSIRSLKPTPATLVTASSRSPTRCGPPSAVTVVNATQSDWRSQSATAWNTASGGAATATRSSRWTRTAAPPPAGIVYDRQMLRTFGRRTFDFDRQVAVMAIVNRTPDSFYDRGATFAFDAAVAAGERALAEGADWLDIGGVKAGPGAPVGEAGGAEP